MTAVAIVAACGLLFAGLMRVGAELREIGKNLTLFEHRAMHMAGSVNRVADELAEARSRIARDMNAQLRHMERIGNKLEMLAALQRQQGR
jgi:hypothetical protein